MLYELAQADAYGAQFEFEPLQKIKADNAALLGDLTEYSFRQNSKYESIGGGRYTDDAQMSAAIAQLILSGNDWSPENIAAQFVEAYRLSPRFGYGKYTQAALEGAVLDSNPVEFFLQRYEQSRINGTTNGSAMRSVPLGVYSEIDEVMEKARLQSWVTHAAPQAIEASQAVALSSHYLLHNLGSRDRLPEFLAECLKTGTDWHTPVLPDDDFRTDALKTANKAIHTAIRYPSLKEILFRAVDDGGDTDTIAAIAVGLGACSAEVSRDLPPAFVAGFEKTSVGLLWLSELDRQLLSLLPDYPTQRLSGS